jgi:transcriptional regulator with XRE-family HTH domain
VVVINTVAFAEFRIRAGYNKTRLARTVGSSPGHITDIEHGRRQPSPELLALIAAALKVPVPALLAYPNGGDGAAA